MGEMITISEAARRVGKTTATLYLAIRKGDLKGERRYGIWLVSESEIEKYKPRRRGRPQELPNPRLRTDVSQAQLARELGISRQRVHQMMNKAAHSARVQVGQALKTGKLIKPSLCERCGKSKKLEAHHADYSKQLEVIWLCAPCHSLIHPHHNNVHGRKPPMPIVAPEQIKHQKPEPRRYCPNCRASITDTDMEAGACTQCGAEVKG